MAEKTLINGKATTEISYFDRGLQYGDGVFETIAVENKSLLCWEDHLERLHLGLSRLNIKIADEDALKLEAISLIESNAKHVIKIIITRGQGGRGYASPENPESTRIISLYNFPEYPPVNSNGITVRICNYRYGHNKALAGIKHMNRLEQVMARSEWTDTTIAEGIVLDSKNNVIEGTMSNVFCVIEGVLCTPNLQNCGVEGVIRNKVLKKAKSLNIKTEIKDISLIDFKKADEIFCCNSLIGIWPITSLEEHVYNVGNITSDIKKALMDTNCIPS